MPKKYDDSLQFCRKLRLAAFFYDIRKESTVILDASHPDDEQYDYDGNKLLTKKSEFNPTSGRSEALEEFISELENYLFNPE